MTWATRSSSPSERRADLAHGKPLAKLDQAAPPRSGRAPRRFRRKLMVRLVVTASGTQPIADRTARYMVKSASAIMIGPETVPPGRSDSRWKCRRTRQPPYHNSSIFIIAHGMGGFWEFGAKPLDQAPHAQFWRRHFFAASHVLPAPHGSPLGYNGSNNAAKQQKFPPVRTSGLPYERCNLPPQPRAAPRH